MAHEQQHGRAILFRGMHANGGVSGAGAARDEQGRRPTR